MYNIYHIYIYLILYIYIYHMNKTRKRVYVYLHIEKELLKHMYISHELFLAFVIIIIIAVRQTS